MKNVCIFYTKTTQTPEKEKKTTDRANKQQEKQPKKKIWNTNILRVLILETIAASLNEPACVCLFVFIKKR